MTTSEKSNGLQKISVVEALKTNALCSFDTDEANELYGFMDAKFAPRNDGIQRLTVEEVYNILAMNTSLTSLKLAGPEEPCPISDSDIMRALSGITDAPHSLTHSLYFTYGFFLF